MYLFKSNALNRIEKILGVNFTQTEEWKVIVMSIIKV